MQTSLDKAGSDGMNLSPDYSAAFCVLETDDPRLTGHGMVSNLILAVFECLSNGNRRPSRLAVAMSLSVVR
jgi:hypothetical protein